AKDMVTSIHLHCSDGTRYLAANVRPSRQPDQYHAHGPRGRAARLRLRVDLRAPAAADGGDVDHGWPATADPGGLPADLRAAGDAEIRRRRDSARLARTHRYLLA